MMASIFFMVGRRIANVDEWLRVTAALAGAYTMRHLV
jgi:hypothetical protein